MAGNAAVTIRIVDAEAFAALVDLLDRCEDGEVWSVDLAAEELRAILERLRVKNEDSD